MGGSHLALGLVDDPVEWSMLSGSWWPSIHHLDESVLGRLSRQGRVGTTNTSETDPAGEAEINDLGQADQVCVFLRMNLSYHLRRTNHLLHTPASNFLKWSDVLFSAGFLLSLFWEQKVGYRIANSRWAEVFERSPCFCFLGSAQKSFPCLKKKQQLCRFCLMKPVALMRAGCSCRTQHGACLRSCTRFPCVWNTQVACFTHGKQNRKLSL